MTWPVVKREVSCGDAGAPAGKPSRRSWLIPLLCPLLGVEAVLGLRTFFVPQAGPPLDSGKEADRRVVQWRELQSRGKSDLPLGTSLARLGWPPGTAFAGSGVRRAGTVSGKDRSTVVLFIGDAAG